ncbi:trehalose-phosphatase [Asaia siamensis]|uniref:Trehalose 6-phosphate phosphatase n=1 Tax=Asaia siamensis TaxID=110479 RepID=A0ABQ1MGG2_9PROT|nr:trehalose-phosphatase [Asaia siamensis]GBR03681.1 trehalose phosphatase [Asaia siamensis NRIC 0323]GGC38592.1 trehalose 6-phosphate phosphatase [Asaia siamensis]
MTTPSPSAYSSSGPSAPSLDRAAFLLDFDGTLVDIAPTPDSVQVEPGLIDTLLRLRDLCGGALAIVTGRPIAQIDHFLPGIPTAVAGEHGLTLRRSPDGAEEPVSASPIPTAWQQQAEALVSQFRDTALERKKAGLVLHYRGNPAAETPFRSAIETWLSGQDIFEIHPSKMAWEIRLAGIHKGNAVEALMAQAPFAGRIPVFVGDDVTDMDGVRAAKALGGYGYLIPDDFRTAHDFRAWLAHLGENA